MAAIWKHSYWLLYSKQRSVKYFICAVHLGSKHRQKTFDMTDRSILDIGGGGGRRRKEEKVDREGGGTI